MFPIMDSFKLHLLNILVLSIINLNSLTLAENEPLEYSEFDFPFAGADWGTAQIMQTLANQRLNLNCAGINLNALNGTKNSSEDPTTTGQPNDATFITDEYHHRVKRCSEIDRQNRILQKFVSRRQKEEVGPRKTDKTRFKNDHPEEIVSNTKTEAAKEGDLEKKKLGRDNDNEPSESNLDRSVHNSRADSREQRSHEKKTKDIKNSGNIFPQGYKHDFREQSVTGNNENQSFEYSSRQTTKKNTVEMAKENRQIVKNSNNPEKAMQKPPKLFAQIRNIMEGGSLKNVNGADSLKIYNSGSSPATTQLSLDSHSVYEPITSKGVAKIDSLGTIQNSQQLEKLKNEFELTPQGKGYSMEDIDSRRTSTTSFHLPQITSAKANELFKVSPSRHQKETPTHEQNNGFNNVTSRNNVYLSPAIKSQETFKNDTIDYFHSRREDIIRLHNMLLEIRKLLTSQKTLKNNTEVSSISIHNMKAPLTKETSKETEIILDSMKGSSQNKPNFSTENDKNKKKINDKSGKNSAPSIESTSHGGQLTHSRNSPNKQESLKHTEHKSIENSTTHPKISHIFAHETLINGKMKHNRNEKQEEVIAGFPPKPNLGIPEQERVERLTTLNQIPSSIVQTTTPKIESKLTYKVPHPGRNADKPSSTEKVAHEMHKEHIFIPPTLNIHRKAIELHHGNIMDHTSKDLTMEDEPQTEPNDSFPLGTSITLAPLTTPTIHSIIKNHDLSKPSVDHQLTYRDHSSKKYGNNNSTSQETNPNEEKSSIQESSSELPNSPIHFTRAEISHQQHNHTRKSIFIPSTTIANPHSKISSLPIKDSTTNQMNVVKEHTLSTLKPTLSNNPTLATVSQFHTEKTPLNFLDRSSFSTESIKTTRGDPHNAERPFAKNTDFLQAPSPRDNSRRDDFSPATPFLPHGISTESLLSLMNRNIHKIKSYTEQPTIPEHTGISQKPYTDPTILNSTPSNIEIATNHIGISHAEDDFNSTIILERMTKLGKEKKIGKEEIEELAKLHRNYLEAIRKEKYGKLIHATTPSNVEVATNPIVISQAEDDFNSTIILEPMTKLGKEKKLGKEEIEELAKLHRNYLEAIRKEKHGKLIHETTPSNVEVATNPIVISHAKDDFNATIILEQIMRLGKEKKLGKEEIEELSKLHRNYLEAIRKEKHGKLIHEKSAVSEPLISENDYLSRQESDHFSNPQHTTTNRAIISHMNDNIKLFLEQKLNLEKEKRDNLKNKGDHSTHKASMESSFTTTPKIKFTTEQLKNETSHIPGRKSHQTHESFSTTTKIFDVLKNKNNELENNEPSNLQKPRIPQPPLNPNDNWKFSRNLDDYYENQPYSTTPRPIRTRPTIQPTTEMPLTRAPRIRVTTELTPTRNSTGSRNSKSSSTPVPVTTTTEKPRSRSPYTVNSTITRNINLTINLVSDNPEKSQQFDSKVGKKENDDFTTSEFYPSYADGRMQPNMYNGPPPYPVEPYISDPNQFTGLPGYYPYLTTPFDQRAQPPFNEPNQYPEFLPMAPPLLGTNGSPSQKTFIMENKDAILESPHLSVFPPSQVTGATTEASLIGTSPQTEAYTQSDDPNPITSLSPPLQVDKDKLGTAILTQTSCNGENCAKKECNNVYVIPDRSSDIIKLLKLLNITNITKEEITSTNTEAPMLKSSYRTPEVVESNSNSMDSLSDLKTMFNSIQGSVANGNANNIPLRQSINELLTILKERRTREYSNLYATRLNPNVGYGRNNVVTIMQINEYIELLELMLVYLARDPDKLLDEGKDARISNYESPYPSTDPHRRLIEDQFSYVHPKILNEFIDVYKMYSKDDNYYGTPMWQFSQENGRRVAARRPRGRGEGTGKSLNRLFHLNGLLPALTYDRSDNYKPGINYAY